MVALEAEAVPRRDLALQDLECLELELHHLAAAKTDQVVVVLTPHGGLITTYFSSHYCLLHDPSFGEERQRPVDGRLRATDPTPLQIRDELLDREVPRALQHGLDDGPPGGGEPQRAVRQESLELPKRLGERLLALRHCDRLVVCRSIETWSHHAAAYPAREIAVNKEKYRSPGCGFAGGGQFPILGPVRSAVPVLPSMNPLTLRTLRPFAASLLLALIPLEISEAEERAVEPVTSERARQLQQALDQIVARTPLQAARAGIVVASLDSGQVLYARDPDALLNPASNVKLFTSAAVLARLGPEYRFDTEVLTDALPSGGVVKSLYVRGKGDPTFVTERLWALAGDIAHRDVKVVKGDLLVDDTFFDGEREGPGYDQERGDRSYLAPVGALSLNFNVVAIHVAPGGRAGDKGRVEVEPPSEYLEVDNRTRTVKATGRRRVTPASLRLQGGRQRITVEAKLPLGSRDQVLYRKIDDPPAYFGWTLKRLLELRGVKVTGQVRRAVAPPTAKLLTVAESESLGAIVRRLDKTSNNFVAEQLLKTLGAEKKGPPGTWPKGVAAVEDFLADAGIPRGAYVMKNGSGLNDANRFSARQTVTLLREMWRRFPLMADFLAALPVAGKDGTTRWRMEGTEGRLRAKTGTLEGVTSLSGYVETAAHDRLVFSILVNDFPGRAHATVRAVDAVGSALAAMGGKPAELGAAVASATAPAPGAEEATADLKAHLATYYRLGRSGDARNVPFLRTALRTEGDPVLRMAAAEAVYLSDPDSDSARRAFLDGVAADAPSFGRLRTLGAGLEAPAPVLGSLADLAAEGDGDALSRLTQLTAAAMAEPGLADGLAELWEEVARSAPDETVRALRAAPAPAAGAAVGLIARGIARADEPHPLPAAVRRAQTDADGELAAYARALAPRLDEQVAAARAVLKSGPAATIGPAPTPAAANGKPPVKTGG